MKLAMLFASLMVFMHSAASQEPFLEFVDAVFLGDQCQALNDTEMPPIAQYENGQVLEISFGQEFNAFTDSDNRFVRSRCRVDMTFRLPDDYQVAPGFVIYLGAADISPKGRGIATARYRLAGTSSPAAVETFPGGFTGDFAVLSPQVTPLEWSQCGGEITLITDANVVVLRSPEEKEIADSKILTESVFVFVDHIRRCESAN